MTKAEKKTPYERITENMIARLEEGTAPWIKPWDSKGPNMSMPYNAVSKKNYRGMNVFILWGAALSKGYKSAGWLTMKQGNSLGAKVRKGEKCEWVIYSQMIEKEDAKGETKKFFFARVYQVFNVEQFDDLPEQYQNGTALKLDPSEFHDRVKALGVDVRKSNIAAFHPTLDYIEMPAKETFKSEDHYYATFMHEMGHWTGHASRLNRPFMGRGDKDSYAREELVAEMTSAFLCATYGINLESLQHPEYLGHWIKVLKSDSKAIIQAASLAQKAADLITGKTFDKKDEE